MSTSVTLGSVCNQDAHRCVATTAVEPEKTPTAHVGAEAPGERVGFGGPQFSNPAQRGMTSGVQLPAARSVRGTVRSANGRSGWSNSGDSRPPPPSPGRGRAAGPAPASSPTPSPAVPPDHPVHQRLTALDRMSREAETLLKEIAQARESAKSARLAEGLQGGRTGLDAVLGNDRDALGRLLDGLATASTHAATNRALRDLEQVQQRARTLSAMMERDAALFGEVLQGPEPVRSSGVRLGGVFLRNSGDPTVDAIASGFESMNAFSHMADHGRAVRQLEQLQSDVQSLRKTIAWVRTQAVLEAEQDARRRDAEERAEHLEQQ